MATRRSAARLWAPRSAPWCALAERLCALAAACAVAAALPTPPPLPPRGWSTWNVLACNVSEAIFTARVDALVRLNLSALYPYANIDDAWFACRERSADGCCASGADAGRSASGELVPDPTLFPRGLAYLADYVHARGMRFGIYVSAGNSTCSGFAGSWGHFDADARSFAAAGVDFVKIDGCGLSSSPEQGNRQRAVAYPALSAALVAAGRPVVYSCDSDELLRDLNSTLERPWLWAPGVCDMWRVRCVARRVCRQRMTDGPSVVTAPAALRTPATLPPYPHAPLKQP